MAIAFDAATSTQEISGDGVLSLSHTATGSELAAFVGVGHTFNPPCTSTATYNGTAMTELWDAGFSTQFGHAAYCLANSSVPAGSSTVVNTMSGATENHAFGVVTLRGVDQTTPVGTPTTTTGFANPASVTVASVGATDLLLDSLWIVNPGTLTPGANQTDIAGFTQVAAHTLRASQQSGADGGVMTWAVGSPDTYGYGAVAFKASAGAAGHPAARRIARSTPGLSPWAVRRM